MPDQRPPGRGELTLDDYRAARELFGMSAREFRRRLAVQMARIMAMAPAERAAADREAENMLRQQASRAEEGGDYRAADLLRRAADS